jgi:hypothetical protein
LRTRPQQIPRDWPLLLVGVRNHDAKAHLGHDTTVVEVLGWIPFDDDFLESGVQWQSAVWLPSTREAPDIMQAR